MEQAAITRPRRRRNLAEYGMALSIALTVVYGVIIAGLSLFMLRNNADGKALAALGIFAIPLFTSWVAIAIWLASRPLWLRWTVAALLLLAPPLILLGILSA